MEERRSTSSSEENQEIGEGKPFGTSRSTKVKATLRDKGRRLDRKDDAVAQGSLAVFVHVGSKFLQSTKSVQK